MIGFELIAQNLERNFLANKLHHGIIIAGKKGIGKASFIKQFCQKILQEIFFFADKYFEQNII